MTTNEKINSLRNQLKQHHLDAYIFTSSDPHQNEYLAEHWKIREWLTGFTGSAGTLVLTQKAAGLWTDSRYFIQAAQELEASIFQLHKKTTGQLEFDEWLIENLPSNSRIGVDGKLLPSKLASALESSLIQNGFQLVLNIDVVKEVWQNRPNLPKHAIFEHPQAFVATDRQSKIAALQTLMKENSITYYIISGLDEIAWLLNLRGSDVTNNPVFYSYLIVDQSAVHFFVNAQKLPPLLQQQLQQQNIQIYPYQQFSFFLQELKHDVQAWFDPKSTSVATLSYLSCESIAVQSPISQQKAIKSDFELKHIRNAMLKDGVALVKFYRWLEATLVQQQITEYDAAMQLRAFRSEQAYFHDESFGAIVGYESNSAIIHYRPEKENSKKIKANGMLLIDSGGQYYDGTTDITRTVYLGDNPSRQQKADFTAVLKAHIALATAIFPLETKGVQLDTLARQAIWAKCLNFGHGTGHGVGYFLNVHEAPPGLSASLYAKDAIKVGMLISNEPGVYRENQYGIRTENLIVSRLYEENDFGTFLNFETLTLFPIDRKLIDFDSLMPSEIAWLKAYHQNVYDKLSPLLNMEEKMWLKKKCGL